MCVCVSIAVGGCMCASIIVGVRVTYQITKSNPNKASSLRPNQAFSIHLLAPKSSILFLVVYVYVGSGEEEGKEVRDVIVAGEEEKGSRH